MKILTLDLATYKAGYGVFDDMNGINRIDSGVISVDKDEIGKRLSIIKQHIISLIDEHSPDAVVMEDSYESRNPKTAKILNYLHGVVLELLYVRGIHHVYYSPTTIKRQVTGDGKSTKNIVAEHTTLYMPNGYKFIDDNESDACAIAVCHFQMCGGGKK